MPNFNNEYVKPKSSGGGVFILVAGTSFVERRGFVEWSGMSPSGEVCHRTV